MKKFFRTSATDTTALLLRLALGIVILAHGLQKTLGWFGGGGIEGSMGFLTGMGIPAALAMLVIVGESLGALSLILGFFTRLCALSIVIIMVGAVLLVHASNGLVGQGGYEFHVLAITMGVVLMMRGGGAFSLDSIVAKMLK